VIRAYRSAQEQQAFLAVEEGLLASRRADLERTRKMFELVGATRVDVLTAELNVQQQQGRIEEAQGQLQRALLQLRTVVGDESMEGFEVTETLPIPFDPGGLEPRALAERAYSANPILIEQEVMVAVREAEAQSARRRNWPGITLNFNVGQGTYGDDWSGFADLLSDRSRSGGSSFGVQIPVFQGFNNKALIVQAEVSLANQEEIFRETRLQVEEDVETRLISVQTAHQRYQISIRSEEIAQERLTLGRERFRLGTRTFSELQQDIDAAANAERDVITQLF
jgi:outer membrane protein TolC